jgi:hypothetical protein
LSNHSLYRNNSAGGDRRSASLLLLFTPLDVRLQRIDEDRRGDAIFGIWA